jgi:hypothetical protein
VSWLGPSQLTQPRGEPPPQRPHDERRAACDGDRVEPARRGGVERHVDRPQHQCLGGGDRDQPGDDAADPEEIAGEQRRPDEVELGRDRRAAVVLAVQEPARRDDADRAEQDEDRHPAVGARLQPHEQRSRQHHSHERQVAADVHLLGVGRDHRQAGHGGATDEEQHGDQAVDVRLAHRAARLRR